jgi:hypothetical protein
LEIWAFMSQKKGTIFKYNFVAGGQIVPKKCLHDSIEKDGWDGRQDKKASGVVLSISSGETHQPTHNNPKLRQASGGTTRCKVSGRRITQ